MLAREIFFSHNWKQTCQGKPPELQPYWAHRSRPRPWNVSWRRRRNDGAQMWKGEIQRNPFGFWVLRRIPDSRMARCCTGRTPRAEDLPLVPTSVPHKPDFLVTNCWKSQHLGGRGSRGSEVQGHLQKHSKCESSRGSLTPYLKKPKGRAWVEWGWSALTDPGGGEGAASGHTIKEAEMPERSKGGLGGMTVCLKTASAITESLLSTGSCQALRAPAQANHMC